MAAQETRQPVFAVEEDLRRRWPAFADLLFGRPRSARSSRSRCSRPGRVPARSTCSSATPAGARPRRVRGDGGRRTGHVGAERRRRLVTGRRPRAGVDARSGPAAAGGGLGGDGQAGHRPRGGRPAALDLLRAHAYGRAGPWTTSPRTCSAGGCGRRTSRRRSRLTSPGERRDRPPRRLQRRAHRPGQLDRARGVPVHADRLDRHGRRCRRPRRPRRRRPCAPPARPPPPGRGPARPARARGTSVPSAV